MAFSKSRIARWLDDDESESCMNPNCEYQPKQYIIHLHNISELPQNLRCDLGSQVIFRLPSCQGGTIAADVVYSSATRAHRLDV